MRQEWPKARNVKYEVQSNIARSLKIMYFQIHQEYLNPPKGIIKCFSIIRLSTFIIRWTFVTYVYCDSN